MNLPNKITVFRICTIPVFLVLYLVDAIPQHLLWATLVFTIASISDTVDGTIARKRGIVTDFGSFLDPLSDKLLVFAGLLVLIPDRLISPIAVFLLIGRDTAVNGLRFIAARDGKVISANVWGKVKTTLQMVGVCLSTGVPALCTLFGLEYWLVYVKLGSNIMWWCITAFTLVTMIVYFKRNSGYIDPNK